MKEKSSEIISGGSSLIINLEPNVLKLRCICAETIEIKTKTFILTENWTVIFLLYRDSEKVSLIRFDLERRDLIIDSVHVEIIFWERRFSCQIWFSSSLIYRANSKKFWCWTKLTYEPEYSLNIGKITLLIGKLRIN